MGLFESLSSGLVCSSTQETAVSQIALAPLSMRDRIFLFSSSQNNHTHHQNSRHHHNHLLHSGHHHHHHHNNHHSHHHQDRPSSMLGSSDHLTNSLSYHNTPHLTPSQSHSRQDSLAASESSSQIQTHGSQTNSHNHPPQLQMVSASNNHLHPLGGNSPVLGSGKSSPVESPTGASHHFGASLNPSSLLKAHSYQGSHGKGLAHSKPASNISKTSSQENLNRFMATNLTDASEETSPSQQTVNFSGVVLRPSASQSGISQNRRSSAGASHISSQAGNSSGLLRPEESSPSPAWWRCVCPDSYMNADSFHPEPFFLPSADDPCLTSAYLQALRHLSERDEAVKSLVMDPSASSSDANVGKIATVSNLMNFLKADDESNNLSHSGKVSTNELDSVPHDSLSTDSAAIPSQDPLNGGDGGKQQDHPSETKKKGSRFQFIKLFHFRDTNSSPSGSEDGNNSKDNGSRPHSPKGLRRSSSNLRRELASSSSGGGDTSPPPNRPRRQSSNDSVNNNNNNNNSNSNSNSNSNNHHHSSTILNASTSSGGLGKKSLSKTNLAHLSSTEENIGQGLSSVGSISAMNPQSMTHSGSNTDLNNGGLGSSGMLSDGTHHPQPGGPHVKKKGILGPIRELMSSPRLRRRGNSSKGGDNHSSGSPVTLPDDSNHNHHGNNNLPSKQSTMSASLSTASNSASATGLPMETHSMDDYQIVGSKVLGKGASGVVRLARRGSSNRIFAIKEFRKKKKDESQRDYIKKLTSEFCIGSMLHHGNVVETLDIIREGSHWYEVLEYCSGGDLYSVIRSGQMTMVEIDCCFKQLLMGVQYLHSVGVAHRDIKPENLLLDAMGRLKITDFGVSDVFRVCWEKKPHMSKGVCGSTPYIAPEEFTEADYDARLVDIWACGIVYYAMVFRGIPWEMASPRDPNYQYFLDHRGVEFEPLVRLPVGARQIMYRILEPDPKLRIVMSDLMEDPWFVAIETCQDAKAPSVEHNHLKEDYGDPS